LFVLDNANIQSRVGNR